MATKPRLFLRHSTDEGSVESKILTDITDALEARYAILPSQDSGSRRLLALNHQFLDETCNAAVLLSRKG
jgi:hypothetical protein